MENFGKFMTILLALIISPIINGFVFTKLWAWFIVPTFNLHSLRMVESIGILFIIGFIRSKKDKNVNKDNFWEEFIENIIFVIVIAGFALLSGWIVTLFM